MGRTRDWRQDPRLAEEENANQEKMNQDRLAQQAQLGSIQAQGIKGLGDAAASAVTGATEGYYTGQNDAMKRQLAEEQLAGDQQKREQSQSDYDFMNQPAEEGAPNRREQQYDLGNQKTQADINKLNAEAYKFSADKEVKPTNWINTGKEDAQGRLVFANPQDPSQIKYGPVIKDKPNVGSETADEKEFERFNDHLTGSMRNNPGLSQEKQKLRNATHALSIIDGGNLNNLNAIQVKEIAGALASQVSQGSPAEKTLQEMTPSTAAGDLSKVFSYMTGKPAPADQGEYVKMFRDMVNRQSDTSKQIIQGELGPVLATYAHLRQKDPKRFDQIVSSSGMTLDDNGQLTAYEAPYMKGRGKKNDVSGEPGTAMAAPAAPGQKPTHEMTEAELDAELARLRGGQ